MTALNSEQQKARRTGAVMHSVGLVARLAVNSYGEPVCIHSDSMSDDSLGVTLWVKGGNIVGVEVTDPTMMDDHTDKAERYMLTRCGLVPTTEYDDRFMDSKRRIA
jgi:hypothetical protein